MAELKTLETKSNEVTVSSLRVSSMPSSAGTVAANKYKPTKTVKRPVPSFTKTQLNATTKPKTFRSAITPRRTSTHT